MSTLVAAAAEAALREQIEVVDRGLLGSPFELIDTLLGHRQDVAGTRAAQDAQQATRLRTQGKYREACVAYARALRHAPAGVTLKLRFQLAVCLDAIGDCAGAQQQYEAVLAADPKNPLALYNLGRVLLLQDDPLAAAEHLTQAVHAFRASAQAAVEAAQSGALAQAHGSRVKMVEFTAAMRTALLAAALEMRGMARRRAGNFVGACSDYVQASRVRGVAPSSADDASPQPAPPATSRPASSRPLPSARPSTAPAARGAAPSTGAVTLFGSRRIAAVLPLWQRAVELQAAAEAAEQRGAASPDRPGQSKAAAARVLYASQAARESEAAVRAARRALHALPDTRDVCAGLPMRNAQGRTVIPRLSARARHRPHTAAGGHTRGLEESVEEEAAGSSMRHVPSSAGLNVVGTINRLTASIIAATTHEDTSLAYLQDSDGSEDLGVARADSEASEDSSPGGAAQRTGWSIGGFSSAQHTTGTAQVETGIDEQNEVVQPFAGDLAGMLATDFRRRAGLESPEQRSPQRPYPPLSKRSARSAFSTRSTASRGHRVVIDARGGDVLQHRASAAHAQAAASAGVTADSFVQGAESESVFSTFSGKARPSTAPTSRARTATAASRAGTRASTAASKVALRPGTAAANPKLWPGRGAAERHAALLQAPLHRLRTLATRGPLFTLPSASAVAALAEAGDTGIRAAWAMEWHDEEQARAGHIASPASSQSDKAFDVHPHALPLDTLAARVRMLLPPVLVAASSQLRASLQAAMQTQEASDDQVPAPAAAGDLPASVSLGRASSSSSSGGTSAHVRHWSSSQARFVTELVLPFKSVFQRVPPALGSALQHQLRWGKLTPGQVLCFHDEPIHRCTLVLSGSADVWCPFSADLALASAPADRPRNVRNYTALWSSKQAQHSAVKHLSAAAAMAGMQHPQLGHWVLSLGPCDAIGAGILANRLDAVANQPGSDPQMDRVPCLECNVVARTPVLYLQLDIAQACAVAKGLTHALGEGAAQFLTRVRLFDAVPEHELAALCRAATMRVFESGEALVMQGQRVKHLSVLVRGKARVVTVPATAAAGEEQRARLAPAGGDSSSSSSSLHPMPPTSRQPGRARPASMASIAEELGRSGASLSELEAAQGIELLPEGTPAARSQRHAKPRLQLAIPATPRQASSGADSIRGSTPHGLRKQQRTNSAASAAMARMMALDGRLAGPSVAHVAHEYDGGDGASSAAASAAEQEGLQLALLLPTDALGAAEVLSMAGDAHAAAATPRLASATVRAELRTEVLQFTRAALWEHLSFATRQLLRQNVVHLAGKHSQQAQSLSVVTPQQRLAWQELRKSLVSDVHADAVTARAQTTHVLSRGISRSTGLQPRSSTPRAMAMLERTLQS